MAAVSAAVLLVLGVSLLLLHRRQQAVEVAGLATARALANQVALLRKVYSDRVVVPRKADPVHTVDVPLPATLVRHLGSVIEQRFPGSSLRLFSRFPFPFRAHLETYDDFELEALDQLQASPSEPFFRLEDAGDEPVMRYAIADVMLPSCVECHNTHPETPKSDWRIGDVRGVLAVTVPLSQVEAQLSQSDLGFASMLSVGIGLIALALLLFVRNELVQAQQTRQALTDEVTGLATRRSGEEALRREVARAKRTGKPLGLVLFDLDHFKQVNDRHGHAKGDVVLRQLGQVLRDTARASDLIVRWGGEEFLAALPDTPMESAEAFAERVRQSLSEAPQLGVHITLSAGVAALEGDESIEKALARADGGLYEAKRAGRNRVRGTGADWSAVK